MANPFDTDHLDDEAFVIVRQAAHLFKHAGLGINDFYVDCVWSRSSVPPSARALADMAEVHGRTLVVPRAPPDSGDAMKRYSEEDR